MSKVAGKYDPIIGVPTPPVVNPGSPVQVNVTFSAPANGTDSCVFEYRPVGGTAGSEDSLTASSGPTATPVTVTPAAGATGVQVSLTTQPSDHGTMAVFGKLASSPAGQWTQLCTFEVP